ncbi:YoaK family protein [Streptomyces cadmiisoli]|uniref:DUF1275 domain-containing protein n=1 Tax=Streptomyces cadmiisoli TaxID=2184053 RepID=A0A2Z4IZP4_9ACTN|nr:YoaK family protein [Streptomyces cadmiisoli]AWW38352.1 DUF1275 domain-containing protein [Streptomyces cadmiisoli]
MRPDPGRPLTGLMLTLTAVTGVIDAVSFLALGPVFTAIQTGSVLLLGFALAGEGELSAVAPTVSLAGFAVGAVVGSRFESRMETGGHRWFVAGLLAEAVLLAAAGGVAWGIDAGSGTRNAQQQGTVAILAVAMGMRNVTTLRAPVPDLSTTVATRSLTAFLSGSMVSPDPRITAGGRAQVRRVAGVCLLFAGGLLGAWLLHMEVGPGPMLLAVAAVELAATAVYGIVARPPRPGPPPTRPPRTQPAGG